MDANHCRILYIGDEKHVISIWSKGPPIRHIAASRKMCLSERHLRQI